MDRALRSLSVTCSCSYRPYAEAPQRQARQHVRAWISNHKLHPIDHPPGGSFNHAAASPYRRRVRAASQAPRGGGGAPNNDDGDPLPPAEGRIVSALVTAGLTGTLAVAGAAIARIDLFGLFRWSSQDDLLLGLASCSAVLALEALLLGPRYDKLLAGAGRPGAKPGAVGLRLRTERVGELLSADSVAATLVLEQACLVAAQVVRRRGLTQTQPLLEAGLVCVREASKELLQRGLLFTFLAAWLADRAFEAGADDTLALAATGAELYVTDAARYVAAAALTGSILPLVFNEAEALRLGVASNLALVEVEQQAEADAEEQRRRRQQLQQQQQRDTQEAVTPEPALAASKGQEEGGLGTAAAREAVAGGSSREEKAAAAEEGEPYDEALDRRETEAMLREYRLYDALGRCASAGPPRLTYALTLLRGVLRFGAPNLTFALTGNLAASLLASAVPQLLLLSYVLRGPKVLLERPAAAQAAPDGIVDADQERKK